MAQAHVHQTAQSDISDHRAGQIHQNTRNIHLCLNKVSIVCYVSNNAHVRIPNNNIPHLSSELIDCGAAGSIQPGLYLKAHVRPYQSCIKRIALVLIDCSAARTVQPGFYLKAHVSPYRSCVKRIVLASRIPQNQL